MAAERSERKSCSMLAEGFYVFTGRSFRAPAEEDARDRTGEDEISDLGDNGDRGKPGVHSSVEHSPFLAALDRRSESLEEPCGERANGRLGVGRLPIDQFACEEYGEMGIGGEHRDLTLNDGVYNIFRP